jgi:hypothetical protein
MPRATISTEATRYDLKSLPGGWVDLRRMSYGERLHRQDIAMTMQLQGDDRRRQQGARMEIKQAQTAVASFELSTCIVAHNLERADGTPMNFKSPMDIDQLDGMIGEEIGALIEEMHNWEMSHPNSSEKSDASFSAKDKALQVDSQPTILTES